MTKWFAEMRSQFGRLKAEIWTVVAVTFTVLAAVIGIVLAANDDHRFLGLGAWASVLLLFIVCIVVGVLWFVIRSGVAVKRKIYIIDTIEELNAALKRIVDSAKSELVATGSRSENKEYLDEIIKHLKSEPRLVHYRILFGHPRRQIFKDHLAELVTTRNSEDRTFGQQTIRIGMIEAEASESFIVANESRGLILIPSLHTAGVIDSAVVVEDRKYATCLINYVKQLYPGSLKVETRDAVESLTVTA